METTKGSRARGTYLHPWQKRLLTAGVSYSSSAEQWRCQCLGRNVASCITCRRSEGEVMNHKIGFQKWRARTPKCTVSHARVWLLRSGCQEVCLCRAVAAGGVSLHAHVRATACRIPHQNMYIKCLDKRQQWVPLTNTRRKAHISSVNVRKRFSMQDATTCWPTIRRVHACID